MRWGWFALALLLVYLVQTAFPHTWLDLLAAFALACGLLLPVDEACLAGWITGFLQDVGGDGTWPLGPHAVALGLAAFVLTWLRDLINRELWWVRWLAGFLVLFPIQVLVRVYERIWQHANLAWWELFSQPFMSAAGAALLAAFAVWVPGALARRRRYSVNRW